MSKGIGTGIVAANLRRARTARQLTISELARLSGINKGTLSQLEAGNGNPTVETLFALATAMDIPMSDLLTQHNGPPVSIVRADQGTRMKVPVGEVRLIRRLTGHSLIELYDLVLAAGLEQQSQPHAHGTTEHLFVTEGRLQTGPIEEPVELRAGDFASFESDRPHFYHAMSDVRAVLLISYRRGFDATS